MPQALAVGAGVLGVGLGIGRVELAQFPGDIVDLGNRGADRQEGVRVDHLAGAACGNAGSGQQRHVFVGLDHRDVRRFAGGDHAVGEIVMADAIEHDHVQPADALDVLGPWLVGVGVETGGNQRHHFGLVADDVGHVAVIRVQGDADAQALGLVGAGQGCQQAGQQADQQTGAGKNVEMK